MAVVVPLAKKRLTSRLYRSFAASRSWNELSAGKVYFRSHSISGTSVPVPVNLYLHGKGWPASIVAAPCGSGGPCDSKRERGSLLTEARGRACQ